MHEGQFQRGHSRDRRQDFRLSGICLRIRVLSSPAFTVPACCAHRRAAWWTQRRTVPRCTPTSPATSPTGRPTPTSPTACARSSSAYGHPTRPACGTTSAGAGPTMPPPARGAGSAAADGTGAGLAANPAEHLGDRLGLLAFKPATGHPPDQPDLVAESRSLGPPWPAVGVLLLAPRMPPPIAQPIGAPQSPTRHRIPSRSRRPGYSRSLPARLAAARDSRHLRGNHGPTRSGRQSRGA